MGKQRFNDLLLFGNHYKRIICKLFLDKISIPGKKLGKNVRERDFLIDLSTKEPTEFGLVLEDLS